MVPLPAEIEEVFSVLKEETSWLHGRWMCYRQLFGTSERRVDLLNECAGTFFFFVHDVLLQNVQVSLSKFTDPAKSGKFENLSLWQLQTRLEIHGDAKLAAEAKQILGSLMNQCAPFRERRNKRLAHSDLLTSLISGATPLPGVTRQMIEDALSSVREYLNIIDAHYNASETLYESFNLSTNGNALIAVLKNGLRYQELVSNGTIPREDWFEGKWRGV